MIFEIEIFYMVWAYYCYVVEMKSWVTGVKHYICIHQSQDFIQRYLLPCFCSNMKRYKNLILCWYAPWIPFTYCFITPWINLSSFYGARKLKPLVCFFLGLLCIAVDFTLYLSNWSSPVKAFPKSSAACRPNSLKWSRLIVMPDLQFHVNNQKERERSIGISIWLSGLISSQKRF